MAFSFKKNLEDAPFEDNLAEYLDERKLGEIGITLKDQAEQDKRSRLQWMDQNKEWLRLASQVQESKSFPWPNASNVKYPLLTTAAMQFHARALPSLIPDERPVKAKVLGQPKPGEAKQKRADRVSDYMSYQLLDEQEEWLDEMDRMLFILPMVGICYKKTFFSSKYGRNKSELILPNEMYINYYAKTFEGATKTHYIPMDKNVLKGLQLQGIYLDVDLAEPTQPAEDPNDRRAIDQSTPDPMAHDSPYELYEIECWLDLDEDGYKEPYIVTIDSCDGTVLRIVARWKKDGIKYNDKGNVAEIADFSQITAYIFLPDPASATSGIGLGNLLGPINEAVNTLTNQLIDAGTLANLQGGFLSKGIGLRGGATRFRPGEWKIVNSSADDLRKNVFPMPVREPSNVLFQLLGMLIQAGERLGSVTDMMVGENPGQNQKATTTMAVLEQGMKVFSSIYKRLYRALRREFRKFYELNEDFLSPEKYNAFFDGEEVYDPKVDFNSIDMDMVPAADPSVVMDSQKIAKSQALLEKLQLGTINVHEATRRSLVAEGQTDIEALMDVAPPPPSVEDREMSLKEKLEPMKLQLEAQAQKIQLLELLSKAELNNATTNKTKVETVLLGRAQELEEAKATSNHILKQLELINSVKESDGKQTGS